MTKDAAHDEAASWHARLNASRVSNADLEAFFAWRRIPANARAYDRLEAITAAMSDLADDPQIQAAAYAAERRRSGGVLARRAALGGGALLLAAATALVVVLMPPRSTVYESAIGERRIVRLADGSQLQLDTDSRARVRLGPKARLVRLDRGQAYFTVAHESRPFRVSAGDVTVTALGTRFEVSRLNGRVGVTLTEGKVAVREGDKRGWTLSPGEEVVVAAKAVASPKAVDAERAVSWTTGRLYFEDASLAEAVAEVNRYSSRKVLIGDGAAPDTRINGAFDTGDVDAFVVAATHLLPLRAEPRSDGAVLLVPRAEPTR